MSVIKVVLLSLNSIYVFLRIISVILNIHERYPDFRINKYDLLVIKFPRDRKTYFLIRFHLNASIYKPCRDVAQGNEAPRLLAREGFP